MATSEGAVLRTRRAAHRQCMCGPPAAAALCALRAHRSVGVTSPCTATHTDRPFPPSIGSLRYSHPYNEYRYRKSTLTTHAFEGTNVCSDRSESRMAQLSMPLNMSSTLRDFKEYQAGAAGKEDEDLSSDDSVDDAASDRSGHEAKTKRGGLEMKHVSEQLEELSQRGVRGNTLTDRLRQHHRTTAGVTGSFKESPSAGRRTSTLTADYSNL
eukprot:1195995-Prorocentrum_minimum.AAC.1